VVEWCRPQWLASFTLRTYLDSLSKQSRHAPLVFSSLHSLDSLCASSTTCRMPFGCLRHGLWECGS